LPPSRPTSPAGRLSPRDEKATWQVQSEALDRFYFIKSFIVDTNYRCKINLSNVNIITKIVKISLLGKAVTLKYYTELINTLRCVCEKQNGQTGLQALEEKIEALEPGKNIKVTNSLGVGRVIRQMFRK